MWNRQELKQQAKIIMKRNYWKMFVISLLATILSGEGVSAAKSAFDSNQTGIDINFSSVLITLVSIAGLLGILYKIFIANVIIVGKCDYFIQNHNENPPLGAIFNGFKGNYLNIVKIMLIKDIKSILWTCLFVIPGIVKNLEYSMIPYILAENPNASTSDAFAQTRQMTMGSKMDIFVLELSFIGWYILGAICCGIGTLFVNPYVEATDAELYHSLKQNI